MHMTTVTRDASEAAPQTKNQAQAARDQEQAARDQARASDEQRQAAADLKKAAQDIKNSQNSQLDASDLGPAVRSALIKAERNGDGSIVVTSNGGGGFTIATTRPAERPDVPPEVIPILGIVFGTIAFCIVGFPLARAFARRMDRRSAAPSGASDVAPRLQAIEQAVDSIALEIERISENQRFATRLLSERTHEPVRDFAAPERDAVELAASPVNTRRS